MLLISKKIVTYVLVFIFTTVILINYKITVDSLNYYKSSELSYTKITLKLLSNYLFQAVKDIKMHLLTLSKIPSVKNVSRHGVIQYKINKMLENSVLAAFDPSKHLVQTRLSLISSISDISFYSSYFFSALRRLLFELKLLEFMAPFIDEFEVYINQNYLFICDKNYLFHNFDKKMEDYLKIFYYEPINYVKNVINKVIEVCDEVINISINKPSNSIETESLLSFYVNEHNLFVKLALYDLFSNQICEISKVNDINIPPNWPIDNIIKHNKVFISGPVLFSESHSQTVWNVAVTIRSIDRQPQSYLLALLDLAFINDLIQKINDINPNIKIFVIDENGVVIAHFPKSLVIKQVNISYFIPEFRDLLDGKNLFLEKKIGNTRYYIAGENLRNYDSKFMPNWSIIIMKSAESFTIHKLSLVFTNIWISLILILTLYYILSYLNEFLPMIKKMVGF